MSMDLLSEREGKVVLEVRQVPSWSVRSFMLAVPLKIGVDSGWHDEHLEGGSMTIDLHNLLGLLRKVL